ncbi:LOW QUALITY PROTEIN: probable inactive receptor kinase At5g67200 [Diospyros lotus]|uniref:LOW QUALITY PROTEIN: probable inactive receptor kinase At5g67200 n=1 Tax=Diospyros lotus TaxID=55363 RepID=UPI00225874FF|nr:LOW QUALITY PROTEIN: probable inactive receptor kinase At5g67200 [Diospyros lotus]
MHTSSFYVSWTLSLLFLTGSHAAAAVSLLHAPATTPLASDAVAILAFKSKADLDAKLPYTLNERYCQWPGVKCSQGRVVRFVVQGIGLRGVFAPDSLSRIDQLRVLSLRNNSLAGPVPDLVGLFNLKSLFLDHNFFSGSFPSSLLSLHRLLFLDLSHNNLTGSIPPEVTGLDLLNYLRLDENRFNGTVPALNQSSLRIFNVSSNNLTGAIPVTPTLSRFGISSFAGNPSLCGEIIDKACRSDAPFFRSPSAAAASPPTPLFQSAQSEGVVLSPPSTATKHKRVGVVLGSVIGALILIAAILCIFALLKRHREYKRHSQSAIFNSKAEDTSGTDTIITTQIVNTEQEPKLETIQVRQRGQKSGKLIFCPGETEMYSLEQLMTASAELLGRGTIGTTYKAVMENRLVVTVKRLDAGKTAVTSGEVFEQHMEMVGRLRHPNLVPVRAYFQAKEERLIIYDYQPNGSLFNLIHGSRSTRAKPLHWTSCLKIAEDVAQGLAYMHQASRLIHGNLKSSNVLLGPDFEACLTDYCLATLADTSSSGDPDSEGYKAPEIRKSGRRASPRSDIYAFGILLLELLTGKPPSQHPFLAPPEMPDWVRAMREDDFEEDNWLRLLVEVASMCSLTSPEQRPFMRQVLEMIQEIKERITVEEDTRNRYK